MFLFATDPTYALHHFQPKLAGFFEVYVAGIIELNEGENISDWFLKDKIDSRSIHYTILSFVPVYDHIQVAVNFYIHKWLGSPLEQLAVQLYSFSATVIHFITNQNEELRILSYPNKRMYDIFKKVFGDQLAALFENFLSHSDGSQLTTSTLCIRDCMLIGDNRISSKAIDLATFFKKSYGTDIDYSNVKNWKNYDIPQKTDWYWGNTSTGKDGKDSKKKMTGGHIHGKKRRHRRVSCTSRKGVCCVQRRRSHKPHISSRKGRCRRSHKPHVNTRIKPRMLR